MHEEEELQPKLWGGVELRAHTNGEKRSEGEKGRAPGTYQEGMGAMNPETTREVDFLQGYYMVGPMLISSLFTDARGGGGLSWRRP
jgi:hypothetical protein